MPNPRSDDAQLFDFGAFAWHKSLARWRTVVSKMTSCTHKAWLEIIVGLVGGCVSRVPSMTRIQLCGRQGAVSVEPEHGVGVFAMKKQIERNTC